MVVRMESRTDPVCNHRMHVTYRYAPTIARARLPIISRPHHHLPSQLHPPKTHHISISTPHYHAIYLHIITTEIRHHTMMLTTSFFSHQMPHYSAYTPPRSSPLSERFANAAPRTFDFTMSSPLKEKSAMPQRAFKANPVIQTRDATTKRRRDMFFKRVQNNRDDKKWESRGEQVRDTIAYRRDQRC